jgi:hypothetical protein
MSYGFSQKTATGTDGEYHRWEPARSSRQKQMRESAAESRTWIAPAR